MESSRTSLEAARAAVEVVLGCPVAIADDPSRFLAGFEEAYCLDPAVQPALTAAYLGDLTASMDHRVVHELHEPAGTRVTLFWLGEALACIGPYTARTLRPGEAAELAGKLRLPSSHVQALTLYRARFAILDSEYAMRCAVALLARVGLTESELGFKRVTGDDAGVAPGTAEPPQSASYADIEQRYAIEGAFMQAITDGDERRALAELSRMEHTRRMPGYLNNPYLGAAILRILCRVAAQAGGLPPVTIDAISQTYAQRLHRSGHAPDATRAAQDLTAMVSEFCKQVRRYRQRPYSGLVRQVVDEIELHLSRDVSPSELAARRHVSASHLARRFKAETGHTIASFVAERRAMTAAQLLATTDQPVRDIAAYVGVLDANYFVKVFKAVHGVTPTEYRRAHSV